MTRRLAAVMIADVAGYGLHSQADEEGARTCFQADLRDVFQPRITEHGRRLVKTMGDGLLVEFHSVVDALRCAIEIQRAKARQSAEEAPDRRQLEFRIGINLGDVIVEGDDIHGDGVIIAERLQQRADKGGLAISGTVYDHVRNKIDVGFEFLGEHPVRHIAGPVRIYRVLIDKAAAGKTSGRRRFPFRPRYLAAACAVVILLAAGAVAWWRSWEPEGPPSIAVLPFDNLSGDAEQGYLADGITEEITTHLALIPGLFVISRNAASQFKNADVDPIQAGAKLRVRFILEGSVRRVGDQLRITAQLIDARTGRHEWAERFDGAWADVFSFQDKVVMHIANAIELRAPPMDSAAAGGTRVAAAYDAYLRGLEHHRRYWSETPEELAMAIPYYEQAIALDPDYGLAHASLAEVYWLAWGALEPTLGVSSQEARDKLDSHLEQALKHPSSKAYRLAASMQRSRQWFDDAIANIDRAIALEPTNASNYTAMAWWMISAGRLGEGQHYLNEAFRLSPRLETENYAGDVVGLVQFSMNRFEEAAATWEKYLSIFPNDAYSRMLLVSALGHLGRQPDATRHYEKANEYFTGSGQQPFSILSAALDFAMRERADAERLRAGFRKAGVPELPFGINRDPKDRLTVAEMRKLLDGHTIRGRSLVTGADYVRTTGNDGVATFSYDTSVHPDGVPLPLPQEDALCYGHPDHSTYCFAIFRNPEGTADKQNEYLIVTSGGTQNEFSVVE